MRLLAIVMALATQLVGVPLSALAACPMRAGGCGDERSAAALPKADAVPMCRCNADSASDRVCPCCQSDDQPPAKPDHPAMPPTTQPSTDAVPSDVPPPAIMHADAVATLAPWTGDSSARPLVNAKRVQAVLCRWRT